MAAEESVTFNEENASGCWYQHGCNQTNAIYDSFSLSPQQAQDPPIKIRSNVNSDEQAEDEVFPMMGVTFPAPTPLQGMSSGEDMMAICRSPVEVHRCDL